MAFLKYARAAVITPIFSQKGWEELRHIAVSPPPSFEVRKATQVVLGEYDPAKFLLTHCTIVASVDTESPGLPLGSQLFDGSQIKRLYPDYRVSLGTSKYINNNHDAFERKLLLSSFRSFVGGQNYVEHVQIPELSKGRIIDAAARDIGDSIYVDILVATERKHKALVDAITSGQLGTLSMGCQVSFTVCTKCGNVAEDETQLCSHIKYEKGNAFIDSKGQRRKIAELCGHVSAEPGSVKFIEASWVANPAFKGAVMRNILAPEANQVAVAREKIQVAFQSPVEVADPRAIQKAAKISPQPLPGDHLAYQFEGPSLGYLKASTPNSSLDKASQVKKDRLSQIHISFDDGMGQDTEEKAPEAGDPFKKHIEDLYETLVDRVKEKVKKDLSDSEADKTKSLLDENSSNESLIKSAWKYGEWRDKAKTVLARVSNPQAARAVLAGMILHSMGGWEAVQNANRFTGAEILVMDRLMSQTKKKASVAGEARVYRTVIAVGGTGKYPNVNEYLAACRKIMARTPTESEKAMLLEKGKLFSLGL
jgi:hypothetical protein